MPNFQLPILDPNSLSMSLCEGVTQRLFKELSKKFGRDGRRKINIPNSMKKKLDIATKETDRVCRVMGVKCGTTTVIQEKSKKGYATIIGTFIAVNEVNFVVQNVYQKITPDGINTMIEHPFIEISRHAVARMMLRCRITNPFVCVTALGSAAYHDRMELVSTASSGKMLRGKFELATQVKEADSEEELGYAITNVLPNHQGLADSELFSINVVVKTFITTDQMNNNDFNTMDRIGYGKLGFYDIDVSEANEIDDDDVIYQELG